MKTMGQEEAANANQAFTRVYQAKIESIQKRDGSATAPFLYQSMEHGEVIFSATGSAVVSITYALVEKQNKIIYASAHALNSAITAHVISVTATSITIECNATADFSSITTGQVTVYYQVIGSNP